MVENAGVRRVRHKHKIETHAEMRELSIASAHAYIVWNQPNRAGTPPLHIGDSGERYSTLTGVWWLSDQSFIVSHRSGLKVAIFDLNRSDQPIWAHPVDHLTDDIAATRTDADTWEFSVSGCWDCIYSRFKLIRTATGPDNYELSLLEKAEHSARDFCHGVAYDDQGQLCVAIHTGKNPRMKIGGTTHKLPAPWGVRDLCYDRQRQRYIAVAVSANPKRAAYSQVMTSLWVCPRNGHSWECLGVYDHIHSDSLDVWEQNIWIPDQLSNRLIAVNALSGDIEAIYVGDGLDFPHGLAISPQGKIAITNYGSSSVTVMNAPSA